jgi:hypothetical protein
MIKKPRSKKAAKIVATSPKAKRRGARHRPSKNGRRIELKTKFKIEFRRERI